VGKKLFFKKKVIDAETGEYITAIAFIPEPKDKEFAKVFKLFGERLLEDLANRQLTGGELKILAWFLAKTIELPIQSEMWIPVIYEKMAEEVRLNKDVVNRYVKRLVRKGYLEQLAPKRAVFRLKPEYVYKGYLVKLKEAEPDF